MIILERLAITRFKGVRGVALDLPERGAILIEGNNEAGKSTLFEAIYFAMYGRVLTGTLADAVPHDAADAEVSLRVRINRHGDSPDILDISRTISAGASQPTSGVRLRVERGGAESEEVRRIGDANRRIAQELGGLTADTFVNSCFVPQKQLAGLETLDRGQREAAVASLLNLDRLTRAAQSFAVRPVDTETLRQHEARVTLAEGTEALATIDGRRITAEANVRRLDVLDAFDRVTDASRREREAAVRARDAFARRDLASRTLSVHDVCGVASEAWNAVATAVRNAVDARSATRRSLARERHATSALAALPDTEVRLQLIRSVEAHVAAVMRWLIEGRPALRQEVVAIEARRAARTRATSDLHEAESELNALDMATRAIEARRSLLLPKIASRQEARTRRAAIDALREAVANRETTANKVIVADRDVTARSDAEARLLAAREVLAEANARLAVLDRDRGALAHRNHLINVRATLASAIAARDIHVQARNRNERLRDLTLGVLDVPTGLADRLDLRLLIDHPVIGSRVVDLAIGPEGKAAASSRSATDEEVARAFHGEIPTLAPANLEALDQEAGRARDALAPLGEAPPPTARAARDRLAELDSILASPVEPFNQAAYDAAMSDRERAAADARVCQSAVDAMDTLIVLNRRAADAHTEAGAAASLVANAASGLGLTVPEDVIAAIRVIDEARRSVDEALEATAEATGALDAADREAEAMAARRVPASARANSARDDLARDDDSSLDVAEATARTAGRAGDGEAIERWRSALDEARSLAVAVPEVVDGVLPAREVVTTVAETVGQLVKEVRDDIARLRARANDMHSASTDVRIDVDRELRAISALDGNIRVARDAAGRAVEYATPELGRQFLDAIQQASLGLEGFTYPLESEADDDLPTGQGASAIAEAFAEASRLVDARTAQRVVDESTEAERDADRASAAARADGDTAWRAAAEASTLIGVMLGDRPSDPATDLREARADITSSEGFEPDRATAVATWLAVLAEVGAANETIASARRTLGDEQALTLAEARARLDCARLELRARERAVTILTTTRARMMAAILPDTQREMSRLLPDLTGGRYRFPRLDDRFQLEVYDERKRGWIRRSLFSGGTQDQFSLALRLGFAIAALPRELGTAPGFLFLDEPLSSFDRDRTRALVDLLRDPTGIVGAHFRQVFLISHSQAFDASLFAFQIEMQEGRVARTTLPTSAGTANTALR